MARAQSLLEKAQELRPDDCPTLASLKLVYKERDADKEAIEEVDDKIENTAKMIINSIS